MLLFWTIAFLSAQLCTPEQGQLRGINITRFNSYHRSSTKLDMGLVSAEKRLIKQLMTRYDSIGVYGRPVTNISDLVTVQYGMGLIQILDLDERNQVLTTNMWTRYRWTDMFLRWDPADHDGVESVRVPAEDIWRPDIVLYNYADQRLKERRVALAVVSYTGEVMWIPMAIFKSNCRIDMTTFPYDEQTCDMKFGSWTYDGFHLDLTFLAGVHEMELNDYMRNSEWAIVSAPARKNTQTYPCCPEPYLDLTFSLTLRRKAIFYLYILILPCVLLSTLTLMLFWLPPESVAKMILGMNIFVAFFLLLTLLAKSTPPASPQIPYIGAYYSLNMIMITISSFLSVTVINLYFRGDRKNRVPPILKTIFIDHIAGYLRMSAAWKADDEEAPPKRRSKLGKKSSDNTNAALLKGIPTVQTNRWRPPSPLRSAGHQQQQQQQSTSNGPTSPERSAPVVVFGNTTEATNSNCTVHIAAGGERRSATTSRCACSSLTRKIADDSPYRPANLALPAKNLLLSPEDTMSAVSSMPASNPTPVECKAPPNFAEPNPMRHRDLMLSASKGGRRRSPLMQRRKQSSSPIQELLGPNPDAISLHSMQQAGPADGAAATAGANGTSYISAEMAQSVRTIKHTLRLYTKRQEHKELVGRIAKEWRLLALVIDRLFFIIYLTAIIFSLVIMLPNGKNTPTLEDKLKFD